MDHPSTIRLLASTNNTRGDLFTRLMRDLFFALGYGDLRLNIHKTGRELDIKGQHRLESRRVIAECKAEVDRIGGADLNKFCGVLTRERGKRGSAPITGYFVSLSGFTESSIEQEEETDDDRVILLNAQHVIAELERSRVLVDLVKAAERAGQCAQCAQLNDAAVDGADLLGHDCGYVWAIYYSQGKQRTHFALVHADGTPLAEVVAGQVIRADEQSNAVLTGLQYLAPPRAKSDSTGLAWSAMQHYQRWLEQECGFIQLDGLPADSDLSAMRIKMERLFIPLKAICLPDNESGHIPTGNAPPENQPIGNILRDAPRLALLAVPGGGKSTLLKRMAIAFALPERRDEIADHLPQGDFLPLLLRCRDLRDRAHRPILELLDDLSRYASMGIGEAQAFRELIHDALCSGHAYLLVDGLDEISDEGARRIFAEHLRSFLAMFPCVRLVVTSREAGFRLVAGVVASSCRRARLAPLDEADVHQLCRRWHCEVVGNNDRVRSEATRLAGMIWDNERIRTLAENPLLLTTLLVIKRWIGELPGNRAALYREAIRVLIRTWNVEGYDPLDEEETLAQLSYVACAMMQEGSQQIGHKRLLSLLCSARQELETELHFARISPTEFIGRIEYRSSLLMQTGHETMDGDLQPVYEFRHLTFQEYLAARGYVQEQYHGRDNGADLCELLEPHFRDEHWQEVIALAAVLAGRRAEATIKRLTRICEASTPGDTAQGELHNYGVSLLLQCLADEVQVSPATLREALLQVGRFDVEDGIDPWYELRRGKFAVLFQEVCANAYLSLNDGWERYMYTLANCAEDEYLGDVGKRISGQTAQKLQDGLDSKNPSVRIGAALGCAMAAYNAQETVTTRHAKLYEPLRKRLTGMLMGNDERLLLPACWALAWIGARRLCTTPPEEPTLLVLYYLWREAESHDLRKMAAWAFCAQPLLPRDTFSDQDWGDLSDVSRSIVIDEDWPHNTRAGLVVRWYAGDHSSDAEIVSLLEQFGPSIDIGSPTTIDMLEKLGDSGQELLSKWRQEYPTPD